MAIFIFYASYGILKDVISPLLGEKPDQQLIARVIDISHSIGGTNIKPHHFHVHQYGYHTELTFHIVMDGDLSLTLAHNLADKIEQQILEEMNIESTIHVEPEGEPETSLDILRDQ